MNNPILKQQKNNQNIQKSQLIIDKQFNKQQQQSLNKQQQKCIDNFQNNKINIRKIGSNQLTSRINNNSNNSDLIEKKSQLMSIMNITPNKVIFENIQENQIYQMCLYIRNQSKQIQKIRIIPPIKKQFKLHYNQNLINSLATGLSIKISIYFLIQNNIKNQFPFQDRIIIIGNQFKKQIPLFAYIPSEKFQIQKIMNIGSIKIKQQKIIKFNIKNKGKQNGIINIQAIDTNQNWPHLEYQKKPILIQPNSQTYVQIKIKPILMGQMELKVKFSDKSQLLIKGFVSDQKFELLDQNGHILKQKDLGQLMIGDKIKHNFFIVNGTQNNVQCLLQTINKRKQQVDIKVDKKRNTFISYSNPLQYSKLVQQRSFILQTQQCNIKSFSTFKNSLIVQKIPLKQQIQFFIKNSIKNIQNQMKQINKQNQNKKGSRNNSFGKNKQINQTLAYKFSNQQKIYKIQLKFNPIIPLIQININTFQFSNLFAKQTQIKYFTLKNSSNQNFSLKYDQFSSTFKQNFKIQGPQYLQKNSQTIYKIVYRPLIKKKFIQNVTIKILDYFPIELKIFAQCIGLDNFSSRMRLTMTDRNNTFQSQQKFKNLLKTKNLLQLTQIQHKTLQKTRMNQTTDNISKLFSPRKTITSRLKKKTQQQQQSPINLLISTIKQQNLINFKQTKQNLFFKKDQYYQSINKKKPFNHPSNLRQILKYECLKLQQLRKIEILQKRLDFGHIFIGSKSVKKFTLVNNLQKAILFQIDTQKIQCLSENKQQPTKIQSFSTYQLQIHLNPTDLGQVQIPLRYIINRQHIFEIKLLAIVTLVNLQLSSRSFNFNLCNDDFIFLKQQNLKISNHGNKKAKFYFQPIQNQSFKLSIMNGQIQPRSNMTVKITYNPIRGQDSGEERIDVEKLKLKVQGGAENIIKCTGIVKQPKILVKQTQFLYQNLIVSVPLANKINIKNLSKVSAYIKIKFQSLDQSSLPSEKIATFFNFQALEIKLYEEQKKDIPFIFLCHELRKIQCFIILQILGCNTIKIPFSTCVVYPQIYAQQPIINFGDASINSNSCCQAISLFNRTKTQIKIQLDPFFNKQQYFVQIIPVKQKTLQVSYQQTKLTNFLNSFTSSYKDNKKILRRVSNNGNKPYIIPPNNQQIVFNFKFVPKLIKQYDFILPIKVIGLQQNIQQPIKIQIKCNATGPLKCIYPQEIKFDTKIIIQNNKNSFNQNFKIINPQNYIITFKIQHIVKTSLNNKKLSKNLGQINFNNNPVNFIFSACQGQIQPNQQIQIVVNFKPTIQGQFNENYSVILAPKNQSLKNQDFALNNYVLKVNGAAILPTLKFSCNEAIVPVVPLSFQSRKIVVIQNHGYDAITICKWKTSTYFPHTQIKVNFIQGKLLSLAKKSLRMQVLFIATVPISFTTNLQLYDEFGNKYQIPLSCTADNSVFTVYPYLQADNQHKIVYNSEQKQIHIISAGKNSHYETNKQITGYHVMSCNFIKKWLNYQFNMNIQKYPQSIIQSEGREFSKMINKISGKNLIKKSQMLNEISNNDQQQNYIQNMTISDFPQSQKQKINKLFILVDFYTDTIKKLKSQRAFLNQIRPQFLLSYSDYSSYQKLKKITPYSSTYFDILSTQSWICLFYQLCKIYIQPQITQKLLIKMKIQNEIFAQNSISNIYSTTQLLILKYINFYLKPQQLNMKNEIVTGFNEQIRIFDSIQKILQTNFDINITNKINFIKNNISTLSPHQFLSQISKLLFTHLKQFGLSVYLQSLDLFYIGAKQLVLYLITLIQLVYSYNNSNYVKFQGAVGDKISKVVQIQNPTNKKIYYSIKILNATNSSQSEREFYKKQKLQQIDNNNQLPPQHTPLHPPAIISNFYTDLKYIIIQPKQKKQLKISYICKNAKGQSGNLYLIPNKLDQNYTIPQPLMFRLNSKILSKIIMKKINVNACLYDVSPITLEVELPSQISENTQFTLSLYEETPTIIQSNINNKFNYASFFFNQSHLRILKQNNKDQIELKIIPLCLGQKICKISYLSPVFGQFIYQIHAKIQYPKISKQFRINELKVNKQQQFSIYIPKQNQYLNNVLKTYYPEVTQLQNKPNGNYLGSKISLSNNTKNTKQKTVSKKSKYNVQVIDCPQVNVLKQYAHLEKLDYKDNKVYLKAHFNKPFKQYSCILLVKNQTLRDIRLYKIIFIVASLPKIIKTQLKTFARKNLIQRFPLKIAPCQVVLHSNSKSFIIQNYQKEFSVNTELICSFKPNWIEKSEATIQIINKETFQELIYQISLISQEPQKIGQFDIYGSSLFSEQIKIPINIKSLYPEMNIQEIQANNQFLNLMNNRKDQYFQIKRTFKRQHQIQDQKLYAFAASNSLKRQSCNLFYKNMNIDLNNTMLSYRDKMKASVNQKMIKQIKFILQPSNIQQQTGCIRFYKPNTEQYFWAEVNIKNRPVIKLKQIYIAQKINNTKKQNIEQILTAYQIDFNSPSFSYKFQSKNSRLKFQIQTQNNNNLSKSSLKSQNCLKSAYLIFSPQKQIQVQQKIFFKFKNKQYILPIKIKSQQLAPIYLPQIVTQNTQQKQIKFILTNNYSQVGIYQVLLQGNLQQNSFKVFVDKQSDQQINQYHLLQNQKKQFHIKFYPTFINQKQQLTIKLISENLPNYVYIVNARSQFKIQQQRKQFQLFQDNLKPIQLNFKNILKIKQSFKLEFDNQNQKDKNKKIFNYLSIVQPKKQFFLNYNQTKSIIVQILPQFLNYNLQKPKELSGKFKYQTKIFIKNKDKIIKKFHISICLIRNLFQSKNIQNQNEEINKKYSFKNLIKYQQKYNQNHRKSIENNNKNKNKFIWICKARQNKFQNIQLPEQLNLNIKDIQCQPEISKFLTFTNSQSNQTSLKIIKIKFSPMKPLKKKKYDLLLVGTNDQKFRIQCDISVEQPPIDDTIIIKTSQVNKTGCVSFKLTNTSKSSVKYKAYFLKNLPQFQIQSKTGILQGYGKPGTPMLVKFKSYIANRKLEDILIIQTDQMYWSFKVKGIISKDK